MRNNLNENLERNDLDDRISQTIHFDEYKPKMGDDDQIIVVSFKVFGRDAATDLETFLEVGYNWILDAETSAGEFAPGKYLVFMEVERRTWFPKRFMELINDLKNVTNVKNWKLVYFYTTKNKEFDISEDMIAEVVPLSPKSYRNSLHSTAMLESMLNSARVPRKTILSETTLIPHVRKPRI